MLSTCHTGNGISIALSAWHHFTEQQPKECRSLLRIVTLHQTLVQFVHVLHILCLSPNGAAAATLAAIEQEARVEFWVAAAKHGTALPDVDTHSGSGAALPVPRKHPTARSALTRHF